jgi:hypothetical protein
MTVFLVVLGVIALWAIVLLSAFRLLIAWADWRHPLPRLEDLEVEEHSRPHGTVHRLDDYRKTG